MDVSGVEGHRGTLLKSMNKKRSSPQASSISTTTDEVEGGGGAASSFRDSSVPSVPFATATVPSEVGGESEVPVVAAESEHVEHSDAVELIALPREAADPSSEGGEEDSGVGGEL